MSSQKHTELQDILVFECTIQFARLKYSVFNVCEIAGQGLHTAYLLYEDISESTFGQSIIYLFLLVFVVITCKFRENVRDTRLMFSQFLRKIVLNGTKCRRNNLIYKFIFLICLSAFMN